VLKAREYVETLRHFHRLMPEYGDKLAYGAVAYLKADEGSAVYGLRRKAGVVRDPCDRKQRQHHQSGGFTPRVFAP